MAVKKYCVNCKHFRPDYEKKILWIPIIGWIVFLISYIGKYHIEFGKCGIAPKNDPGNNSRLHPKYDKNIKNFYYASVERCSFGNCGPDAKLYEEK